jgi:hypothetical protein
MNTIEIKEEISKVIDSMPDEALEPVLEYLKSLQQVSPVQAKRAQILSRILIEDRSLLERLAK